MGKGEELGATQGTAVTKAGRDKDMVCRCALELERDAIMVDQSSEGTKKSGNELAASGAALRLLMEIKDGCYDTEMPC